MSMYQSMRMMAEAGREAQRKMTENEATQSQIQITITGEFVTPEKCDAAKKLFLRGLNECKFSPSAAEIMQIDHDELAAYWQATRRHANLVVNPVALTLTHAGKTITVY